MHPTLFHFTGCSSNVWLLINMSYYNRINFDCECANVVQCYTVINFTCNSSVIPEDPGAWDCPENPCQIKNILILIRLHNIYRVLI